MIQARGRYAVIGFPWDFGASLGRPGSRYAPKAIREALGWFLRRIVDGKIFAVEEGEVIDLSEVHIEDMGDLEIYAHDVLRTFDNAYNVIKGYLLKGYTPMVLGGDHSITYPSVKALHDSVEDYIGIIQFDAHLDLVDENPYQGRYSHSSGIRRALELERVKRLVQIGVRGYNYPFHYSDVRRYDIMQITPSVIHVRGLREIVNSVLRNLDGIGSIYITIDIDVLDPSFAPGSGANEPGGLAPWELLAFIREFAPCSKGIDIVEVNPPYDISNITSTIAARIAFDYIIYRSISKCGMSVKDQNPEATAHR
ncbi:MAG: agmatinase family protein [Desulfurococcales archaeon]|jgi:formiminoglutamase/agmatinase|nr:agmatinase family protein [Desulfurococcales archaeon]